MNTFESHRIRVDPVSGDDRQLIRMELAELLKNLHFASSKRYPALLQYVVEKTLDGRSDEIKERILGIEVFNRPSDYDTNNDTVVRVAAGEVRKRLALTYLESGDHHTIQILLPTGSYVPEFYRQASANGLVQPSSAGSAALAAGQEVTVWEPAVDRASAGGELLVAHQSPEELRAAPEPARSAFWRRSFAGLAIFLLGAAFVILFSRLRANALETSVDRFWQPVRASGTPVILCLGSLVPTVNTSSGFTEAEKRDDYPYISMATAGALTSLVDLSVRNHTQYSIQPSSSTTLTDMRLHPAVLVGAYNNKWTVLMLNDLRFRFTAKPVAEIYDSRDPSKIWSRPDSLPYKDADDYAIVARFRDQLTDNIVVVLAGVGKNGTEAAAQFVTTPRYLDLLDRRQSHDWASKNVEIVLKTTVVDSKTGAPSIEAVEVW